jgi:Domain of unknown function (DUF1732)
MTTHSGIRAIRQYVDSRRVAAHPRQRRRGRKETRLPHAGAEYREANTLGSKAADISITQVSMNLKLLIEQMREQIQNIE